MANAVNRYKFEEAMRAEGMTRDDARVLLRAATTLHRLAEAQCNGDWPADHGSDWPTEACGGAEEKGCGSYWHPSALKGKAKQCPDCRIEARVKAVLARQHRPEWEAIFNGDPRGAVLKVKVPSGRTDDWGREGVCVP